VKSPVAASHVGPDNAVRSQAGEEPEHSGTFRETGGFPESGGFREQ
jgi:hypothetical protein